MSRTTIEEQLVRIRQRVGSIRLRLHADGRAERSRIERHLEALHDEEVSLRSAARSAPDEVEERLGRLRSRLDVAEHALTADSSGDWATFAAAVEAELRSWDTYLERLQTTARVEGVEGARAGRDGDRERPHPPDRRGRAPRGGA